MMALIHRRDVLSVIHGVHLCHTISIWVAECKVKISFFRFEPLRRTHAQTSNVVMSIPTGYFTVRMTARATGWKMADRRWKMMYVAAVVDDDDDGDGR